MKPSAFGFVTAIPVSIVGAWNDIPFRYDYTGAEMKSDYKRAGPSLTLIDPRLQGGMCVGVTARLDYGKIPTIFYSSNIVEN